MNLYIRVTLFAITLGAMMGIAAAGMVQMNSTNLNRYDCKEMVVFQKSSLFRNSSACQLYGGLQ